MKRDARKVSGKQAQQRRRAYPGGVPTTVAVVLPEGSEVLPEWAVLLDALLDRCLVDFSSEFVDEFVDFLFLSLRADVIFLEEILDLLAEVFTLFGSKEESRTGADDGAAEECCQKCCCFHCFLM